MHLCGTAGASECTRRCKPWPHPSGATTRGICFQRTGTSSQTGHNDCQSARPTCLNVSPCNSSQTGMCMRAWTAVAIPMRCQCSTKAGTERGQAVTPQGQLARLTQPVHVKCIPHISPGREECRTRLNGLGTAITSDNGTHVGTRLKCISWYFTTAS